MGKGDNKPRGRTSAYAFFVRTCREEHKKKHPDEAVGFAEFSKRCAERWKTMSEKEKKRFHQMAEKDKKRYDSEMASYVPVEGEGDKKKRKRTKDPNAPKRNLSAFFCFSKDERPKVKETMPDSSVGDVAKELGKRWNECSPDTKSKYEALAAKDKARYVKEVNIYNKGQSSTGAASSKKAKPSTSKAIKKKDSDDESVEEEAESEEEEDDDDE